MRKILMCIIHCSDSDVASHDNVQTIRRWHFANGWSDIGYNYVITKDGEIHVGRTESQVGAHTKGHNANSIGICLTGRTKFTDAQFASLERLLTDLMDRYSLEKKDVLGHCDFDFGKTCPNFSVHEFMAKHSFNA